MENFINFIDTSFDDAFYGSNIYTWLPWVGKTFLASNAKTLILGESTYNWEKDEGRREIANERLKNPDHLRIVHKNNAIDFKGKSPYARNIERAILLKRKADKSEALGIWSNVAYHNLVLRAMHTANHRPKYNDYLDGWHCFIELAKTIPFTQCIVYGLESEKIKAFQEALNAAGIEYDYKKIKPGVGKNYPRVMNIDVSGKNIKMLFVRHPSSFFSWKKWGHVLNSELDLQSLSVIGI